MDHATLAIEVAVRGTPSRHSPATNEPASGQAWRRRAFVTAIFAAATAAMLRRTPFELANRLPGNLGDSAFVLWVLRWNGYALLHNPLHVFDANLFWPYPHTLAYSEPLLSVAPVYSVLYGITGNWTLSWNILWLALIGLNLGATYSLTRWLTGRTDAAIFAALVSGFSAFILQDAGHPQLQLFGFIPLGLLLLFKLLEQPSPVRAVALGVVNVVIATGTLYLAVGYAIVVVVILAGFTVMVRGRFGRRLLGCLALAGLVFLLAVPALVPYEQVAHTVGRRPLAPLWGLRPRDIVRPADGSYIYKSLSRNTDPGSYERHLFPGFMTISLAALGLAALIHGHQKRRWVHRQSPGSPSTPDRRHFLILLVIAGAVGGVLAIGATDSGTWTPWRTVYNIVPGISGIRAPARLASVSILAGAVLAGTGLAAITTRLGQPALRVAVALLACAFVLIELAAPLPYTHLPDDRASLAVYHALSRRPGGSVAELPMFNPATDPSDWSFSEPSRMVWSTIDHNPRINGYSGAIPPTYVSEAAALATLPSNNALATLSSLRVRYLILHVGLQTGIQMYTEEKATSILRGLPTYANVARYGPNYLVDLGRR
jgi:hypothetical protein